MLDVTKKPAQTWAMDVPNTILTSISSSLSIIGSLIIVVSYILFKDIRTSSRHIIVCISIADFLVALSNLSGIFVFEPYAPNDICIIQSFISSSAILSSFLWTMMLAIFLYIIIVKGNVVLAESLIHPYFHLLCWLLPIGINVAALCFRVLGNSGDETSSGWCWIDLVSGRHSREVSIVWMIIDGKGIEVITYITVMILYLRIKIFLHQKIKKFERSEISSPVVTQVTLKAAKTTDRKLILVPILLILLRLWGTIRFFLFVFRVGDEKLTVIDKILIILQAIGDNLQGFVNCILFCFLTPKVWNHLRDLVCYCRFCFPSCRRAHSDELTQLLTDRSRLLVPRSDA